MKKIILFALFIFYCVSTLKAQSYHSSRTLALPEYVPEIDLNLYRQGLSQKTNQYYSNLNDLKSLVVIFEQLVNRLATYDSDKADYINYEFYKYSEQINKGNYDFSKMSVYNNEKNNINRFINWIHKEIETSIAQKYTSPPSRVKTTKSNYVGKVYEGTVEVYTCSPIMEAPNQGGKEKHRLCTGNNIYITILSKYNDKYYLVEHGNIRGYMDKYYFK